eukprot:TRINITY_DN6294_c0_g1_i1.p1 TRINITY_DN6294_c0_g1~~TRINITY_DN6294_c0_g1_i1.p1  ORF type:complete len:281 (+),score=94.98 TRINITY_DN6294_c0_g1_i1:105-947(+)
MSLPAALDGGGGGDLGDRYAQLQRLLEAERTQRAVDVQKLRSELDQQQSVLNELAEQMISLTDGCREGLQKQQERQQASDHLAALESAILAQEKQQGTLMDLVDLEREARNVGLDELSTKLSQELMIVVDLAEKMGEKLKFDMEAASEILEKKHGKLSKECTEHIQAVEARLRDLTSRLEWFEVHHSTAGKGVASTSASGCDVDDLSTRDGCETASCSGLDDTRRSVASLRTPRYSVAGTSAMAISAAQGAPRTLQDIQHDLRSAYRRLQDQVEGARASR